MSEQITTAFVNQYKNNVDLLSQQMGSKLEGLVRVETMNAEYSYYEQIKPTTAQVRTTRHQDTQLVTTKHRRRRVGLTDYTWADLIDTFDQVKMLIDPTNAYARNAAMAMGRARDQLIIDAATGNASSGKDGSTTITFAASGNSVSEAASAGMTINKLLDAKYILDSKDVDESIPRILVVHPYQIQQLLNITEVKSSDYNTIKALARGEIDTYLGFKIVTTTLLNKSGNTRTCFAYAQDGLLLAKGIDEKGPKAMITQRADKDYSYQVYAAQSCGATRMDEDKVVKIECDEA